MTSKLQEDLHFSEQFASIQSWLFKCDLAVISSEQKGTAESRPKSKWLLQEKAYSCVVPQAFSSVIALSAGYEA